MPGVGRRPVSVRLPQALLQYWDGPSTLELHARTLAEALAGLEERSRGLGSRIADDQGRVRRHIAVFINGELVDVTDPAAVALHPGDSVRIVPAVSGG